MSIFSLKQSESDLESSNRGVADFNYDQITCVRSITGSDFPNGSQFFKWQVSGSKWWVPSKSYFRVRGTLSNGDSSKIKLSDLAAPTMNPVASLYQSVEFRMADKTVERISDYVAEIDTMDKRINKSQAWLKGVGDSISYFQPEVQKRMNSIATDGIECIDTQVVRATMVAGATSGVAIKSMLPSDVTVQITAANDFIFVSATQVLPDLMKLLGVGQQIALNDGVEKVRNITQFSTTNIYNDTFRVDGAALTAVGAAALVEQVRVGAEITYPQSSRRSQSVELIWQPSMGIFKLGHALPAGKYEMVMNPHNSNVYQQRFFETTGLAKVQGVGATNLKFNIDSMYLYLATVEGPRADDVSYLLDLECLQLQTQNITSLSGFQQTNFDVAPSNYALSVAFSSQLSGTSTLYPPQKFKADDAEMRLNRFFINYAGMSKPSPDADPQFQPGSFLDYTTQRYVDTMLQNGSYFDNASAESISEWQKRGPYYFFQWPRDGTDRSTRVNVHYQFDQTSGNLPILQTTGARGLRLMCFDHYRQVVKVSVQNGQIVAVYASFA
jgi:hypothetical protein